MRIQSKVRDVADKIQQAGPGWCGGLGKMNAGELVKTAWQRGWEERPRGRPRKWWLDCIKGGQQVSPRSTAWVPDACTMPRPQLMGKGEEENRT